MKESDILPLNEKEIDLIWFIRNRWRWGDVVIEIQDGVPNYLVRTVERQKLGGVDKKVDIGK
jgi:hypothetical protein